MNAINAAVTRDVRHREPWWKGALPRTLDDLRPYFRSRLPGYSADVEEVLSATAESLVRELGAARRGLPISWYDEAPPGDDDAEHFRKLAFAIARRRLIDHFREHGRSAHRSLEITDDIERHVPDSRQTADRTLLLQRMSEVVVREMESMTAADREVLIKAGDGVSHLESAERKRLQRARSRLRAAIIDELGDDAAALLVSG